MDALDLNVGQSWLDIHAYKGILRSEAKDGGSGSSNTPRPVHVPFHSSKGTLGLRAPHNSGGGGGGPLAHGASASVGVGRVPPLPLQCGATFGSSGGSRGRGARRRLPVAADDNDDIPPAEVPINYFS
jgi:hypothetical protein